MTTVRSLEGIQIRLLLSATVKNVMNASPYRASTGAISTTVNPNVLSGSGESQANRAWDYRATIAAGASLTIDLFDFGSLDSGSGAGKDIVGLSVQLDSIVAILIQNITVDSDTSDSEVPGALEIEPAASNGWTPIGTHTVANGGALEPGGLLLKVQIDAAGFPVTDASNHQLKLTANGGDVDFQILVLGREV
jgi:hypothetical protein